MTELGGYSIDQNENSKIADSVGFVLNGINVKIVDALNNKILGPNQIGELWIKSSIPMLGYYKNPAATEEKLDNEGREIIIVWIFHLHFILFLS